VTAAKLTPEQEAEWLAHMTAPPAPRRIADHTKRRRNISDIRQDVASAARALRVHAEAVGRMRAEMKLRPALRLIPDRVADLKAEAEYCEELERWILKHFNSAVRKARKDIP
jgi:hypothetical protein